MAAALIASVKTSRMTDKKMHWENVYAGKSPLEVSWYQQEPELSLRLIRDAGVSVDEALIDVGGGASTLVDELVDAGHRAITVLDLSARALNHARARLGGKAGSVTWIEADVTGFDPPRQYQLWHDRAVFHFLTDAGDRRAYVSNLRRALQPGGQVIIMTFAIGGPKKCSGLDIVQYDADKLSNALGRDFSLLDSGLEVHRTPSGGEQKFAWFRLVRETP